MKLVDLINKYKKRVLYLSSGFDFHVLEDLQKINKLDDTLIIMLEIYPDIYKESRILESNNYSLIDIFSNKVILKNIKLIDKLDLNIDKRLYNLSESKYLNNVYYISSTYITNLETINSALVYVVSENATFVMDYLIKNNTQIDSIYLKGIKGSNVNCAFLNKVLDKLNTKNVITNNKNILNKIDLSVEEVYTLLKTLKPYTYNTKELNEIDNFVLIDTKNKKEIEDYQIRDKKNLSININNNIFKIDFLKNKSEFNKDTSINGFIFKANSINNIIGLDLISFFGLHIENQVLVFISYNKNNNIKKFKIYDNFLYVLDNKIIRSLGNIIQFEELLGLEIEDLGLDGYIDIEEIKTLDIEGEYV